MMDDISEITIRVITSVAMAFDISIDDVKSNCRIRQIVDARKAIMYILTRDLKMSPGRIAKMINKSHCAMNYMLREAEKFMENDIEFKLKVNKARAASGLDNKSCPCCGRLYDDNTTIKLSTSNSIK